MDEEDNALDPAQTAEFEGVDRYAEMEATATTIVLAAM